jgi:hypothetical protein
MRSHKNIPGDFKSVVQSILASVLSCGRFRIPVIQTLDEENSQAAIKPCSEKPNGKPMNLANTYGNLAKLPFRPISSLLKKFYPGNISHMPVVKSSTRLDLERKFSFFKVPI